MNKKSIITLSIIVFILALLIFFSVYSSKMPLNDNGVIGNTACNLNNNGLFCENDGIVYFSNPYDNGALYSMDVNEGNVKKILNVGVKSINADSRRIYYSMSGASGGKGLGFVRRAKGLYSIKKNGSGSICYTQDAVGIASLSGSNLYYQHYRNNSGTDLDKIRIDKKDNRTVVANMVSPAGLDYGTLYYAGASEDMYLYALDTATDISTCLYERQMYNPVYIGGDIYYIDLESNYILHRYNLSSGEDIALTNERVEMFNVCNNEIYYQSNSSKPDAALKRISIDGGEPEIIAEGVFCDINATSTYVYFHKYDEDVPIYHQMLYGDINVGTFDPGVID